MGSLISRVPKIDKLDFKPFPSRPIRVERMIRVDDVVIAVTANGTLYTNSRAARNAAYAHGNWPWQEPTMRALVKLGVISQEQMDEHLAYTELLVSNRDKQYARDDLERLEKRFGIKIPKRELKKLDPTPVE